MLHRMVNQSCEGDRENEQYFPWVLTEIRLPCHKQGLVCTAIKGPLHLYLLNSEMVSWR